MNLFKLLKAREEQGKPIRVGLIGAGKFGAMYLSQVARTPGMHMLGIADLAPDRARATLERVGWQAERYAARSLDEAFKRGTTAVIDDGMQLIKCDAIDVIIDATGHPSVGIAHVLACCEHGKHIIAEGCRVKGNEPTPRRETIRDTIFDGCCSWIVVG